MCEKESAKKEVRLMAKPIPSTPDLKGQDLVNLINDLKRPDTAKEMRKKAVASLKLVSQK